MLNWKLPNNLIILLQKDLLNLASLRMERVFLLGIALLFSGLTTNFADAADKHSNLNSQKIEPAENSPAWIRRLVVFPFKSEPTQASATEAAWWRVKEVLTEPRRFLLASRQFLVQKDVFQPRANLQPADVVLLGKLLDSNAIMTGWLDDHSFKMVVYSARDGLPLWKQELPLSKSQPLGAQILPASEKLAKDFLASVPYQGYQIIDPLIGTPLYEEGDVKIAKVDGGNQPNIRVGDSVHWLQVERTNVDALFQNGGKTTVIAEGEVVQREGEVLLVRISRAKSLSTLREKSLVSFPAEALRLRASLLNFNSSDPKIIPDWVQADIRGATSKTDEKKPFAMALTAIANIAALLLLAL